MKKTIIFSIIGIVALIAILGGIKALQIGKMIDNGKKFVPPPETVTSATVAPFSWESSLTAVGTLTAVQGVTIAAELPGKVVNIHFEPGTSVQKGQILLRQDISSEEAQLPGAVSQLTLANASLKRADKLFADGIISQSDHDTAVSNAAQSQALVDTIRATIAKKTVRAPFSGRLGIRQVNLGQILRDGDPIVSLQSLDPIYVDFSLPQQQLAQVRAGMPVRVNSDALPGETVSGKITAISPLIDSESRNIKLQATVANRGEKLRPGLFVNVVVGLPQRQNVLALPATSVLYAPYGDSVYLIEKNKDGKGGMALRQQFVRLGEKRGDFVAVTSGVKEGESVVSTGVFKLRNGQSVVIDNKLAPPFQQQPKPENN
ncbi:MAG: efflux RND transporter periplasmic adaptor subunit [Desulfuromonadales bacterium]